jgi:hypothetical protein
MTNLQLYLVIGIPLLGNAVLIGLPTAYTNAKIEGFRGEMSESLNGVAGQVRGDQSTLRGH